MTENYLEIQLTKSLSKEMSEAQKLSKEQRFKYTMLGNCNDSCSYLILHISQATHTTNCDTIIQKLNI